MIITCAPKWHNAKVCKIRDIHYGSTKIASCDNCGASNTIVKFSDDGVIHCLDYNGIEDTIEYEYGHLHYVFFGESYPNRMDSGKTTHIDRRMKLKFPENQDVEINAFVASIISKIKRWDHFK